MKTTANSKLSILVVDDDENIRMVLRQSLEKEGYHVSTSNSAEEALNTLQRSFFHVVITDIMMGEMNGVELLLQIKEINSLMQIYVMTSHGTLPHVIQCMQGGAYDFFEKPLKIEDILISLGEAARRATRWSSLYSRHSLSAKGQ
jgi:DNA-binding NtrC family response regulator